EAVEVAVRLDATCLLGGVALVVGLDAARGFQDGAQFPGRNIRRFGVTGCGAGNGEERPELALGEGSVEHDEFAVERFAAAVLGTAQPAVLAGTTGADDHAHGSDRAVRDHIERTLRVCIVKVVSCHCGFSYFGYCDFSYSAAAGWMSVCSFETMNGLRPPG